MVTNGLKQILEREVVVTTDPNIGTNASFTSVLNGIGYLEFHSIKEPKPIGSIQTDMSNIIDKPVVKLQFHREDQIDVVIGQLNSLKAKLKVDKSNTITIKRLKDSWNREEMEALLIKHQSDYRYHIRKSNPINWSMDIKEWINNNL